MALPVIRLDRFLKELRELRKLEEADVAEELGISLSQYRALEAGRRPLPPSRAAQVAELYGLDRDLVWYVTTAAYGMHYAERESGRDMASVVLGVEDYGRIQPLLRPKAATALPDYPEAYPVYRDFALAEKPTSDDFRRLRRATRLTSQKFAELLGVSWGSVRNWETAVSLPRPDNMEAIRAACRRYLLR